MLPRNYSVTVTALILLAFFSTNTFAQKKVEPSQVFQKPSKYDIEIAPLPIKTQETASCTFHATVTALEYDLRANLKQPVALSVDYLVFYGVIEQIIRFNIMMPLLNSVATGKPIAEVVGEDQPQNLIDSIILQLMPIDGESHATGMYKSAESHLKLISKYGITPAIHFDSHGKLEKRFNTTKVALWVREQRMQFDHAIASLRQALELLKEKLPEKSQAKLDINAGSWLSLVRDIETETEELQDSRLREIWLQVMASVNALQLLLATAILESTGLTVPTRFTFQEHEYTPLEFARGILHIDDKTFVRFNRAEEYIEGLELKIGDWSEDMVFQPVDFAVLEERMKQALLRGNGVLLGLNWQDQFEISPGIMHLPSDENIENLRPSEEDYLNNFHGHGVVIVGIKLDDSGKINAYKIQNSWGTAAGDNGFFHLSRAYFQRFVNSLDFVEQDEK